MKLIPSFRASLVASAGAAALFAVPVFAATAGEVAADAADAAAADVAAEDSAGLTEIIVTATKRETSLQKTPIAISVIGADDIKKRQVGSLAALADGAVPSLRVATFESRQSALTVGIRGIVPFDANQTARDQGVGVYIDGVYLGRQQGLNAALFDVQRIEVLRGPQGTLFGRNTEGGALSIVTREPTGEFGGRVVAGVGNFGSYNGEAHIDLPVVENLAVKLDGVLQNQGDFVKNPLAGQAGWGGYNRIGGRVSAKWTPVERLSVLVAYDKARDESTPYYSQLLNYNPNGYAEGKFVLNPSNSKYVLVAKNAAAGDYTACTTCVHPLSPLVTYGPDRMKVADIGVPQQPTVGITEGVSVNLKFELADQLELRSLSAWRTVSTDQWDNSGGAHRSVFAPNETFSRYSLSALDQRQFSQEFQLVGSVPHLDFVLGAYYFNERAQEEAATPITNTWNADGTAYTINNALLWNPENWVKQRGSYGYAKSYALFGQATYTPPSIEALKLTVGGRYTHDKRNGALYVVRGDTTPNPITGKPFNFNYNDKRFDPMVTLAFEAAPTINLYAKYATGYRAGGANSRSAEFTAFDAEEVKSYELGAKMDLFDRRVRLNIAGYMMDRTGTQIDFDNVDNITGSPTKGKHTQETRNAPGVSKIKGVEVDLKVNPLEGLTMGLSYAYTDVKVPDTINPFLSTPTNTVYSPVFTVFTPKHAVSGDMDYTLPVSSNGMELRFHLDASYADPQYTFQAEPVMSESSFLVNARLALAEIPLNNGGTKATIALWARNLLDETYIYRQSDENALYVQDPGKSPVYTGVLGSYVNLNPPRTFGIEGTISF